MNASADKIRRYVNNIFHQKSFYPIFPYGMPASIEHLHEYANLNKIPNIMILPSDLKYYIRDINGCLCVNPGHSYESGKLGTFARLVIQSPKDEKSKFISGQVVNL
jgi:DNA polymerase alpha subunit B